MRHFLTILLSFMILLCSSCSEYKNIRVYDPEIKDVKISGLSSVDVTVGIQVKNPTRQEFTITRMDGEFTKGENSFATLSLKEANSVPSRFEGEIPIVCRLKIHDILDIFANGLDLSTWSLDDFMVKGSVTVSSSNGLKKKIRLKKAPLTEVVGNSLKL